MLLAVKTRNMIGTFQSLLLQFDGWLLLDQIVGCLVVPSLSVLLDFFNSSLYGAGNCWLQFCYLSLGHMFLSLDMARLKQFSNTYMYIYMYSIKYIYMYISIFFLFLFIYFYFFTILYFFNLVFSLYRVFFWGPNCKTLLVTLAFLIVKIALLKCS